MNVRQQPIAMAHRIRQARPGQRLDLRGTVASSGTIQVGGIDAYRVTLRDDHAEWDLIFLGRPRIRGFTIGMRCTVTGRAGRREGRLVLWDPGYQLTTAEWSQIGTADIAAPVARGEPHYPPNRLPDAGSEPELPGWPRAGGAGGADVAEASVATGRFRVYLGPAPGVGKTYAMLDEAHRRQDRGSDIVVAVVNTHGRPATTEKLAGLESVPLKVVRYRGAVFHEMDLDAVLARHPDVALVDELAHTNIPGSGRNEKRWQDIMELLAADIDVISTLNIQHVESLADVVEHIAGAPVRERVPDQVLRRADQIELVDSSPEQLRRRMIHGNIYPQDRVEPALHRFFRTDVLAALRELALRYLADGIDDELIARPTGTGTAGWEIDERVLVGVTAAPGAAGVLRRAARIAARLKADLHVVHVRTDDAHPADSGAVTALHSLTDGLGGCWHELEGDPAMAIMDFAKKHHITQIVIGRGRRSRWQRLTGGGSIVRRLTRGAAAAGIDLHIVVRDPPYLGLGDAVPAASVDDDDDT